MKKMTRFFSAFLAVLTLVLILGVLPETVHAATIKAPVVTASNNASTGKITLTWKDVSGAVKYEIYRATSEKGTYSRRTTTEDTTYTDKNATAGKQYYYYVKAISSKSGSAKSKVVSRTCDLARPVVKVSNVASSGAPKVSWEAVDGAVKYKVYRATSKNGTYSLLKTTTSTSCTNTSAKAGNTYYYKVKAIAKNSAADSAYSSVKSRVCDLAQPEISVTNVSSTGYPKVTWEAVSGATKYKVYRATSKSGTYSLMTTTTSTSYTNTSAKAGNTYYYKVKAIAKNSDADSAYSSVKSRICDLARPEITVSLNSSNNPRVTWDKVTGAVSYKVYRATSKSGTYSLMKTTTSTSYTNTSVTEGKTYYYKVMAVAKNTDANSAYSAVKSIKVTANSNLRYTNLPTVSIYVERDSSSKSIQLPYMTELTLGKTLTSSDNGKWCEVYYQSKLYYIWIPAGSDKLVEKPSEMKYTGQNDFQEEVLDLAMTIYKTWDTSYVSGAVAEKQSDGTIGFDCSSFVTYIINTVMKEYVPAYRLSGNLEKLYNTTSVYNTGYPGEFKTVNVKLKDIQPGDVIFFKSLDTNKLNHCGLYLGNNEFIHCTSTWDRVTIMPLTENFEERFICVKRYIPTKVTAADVTRYVNTGTHLYDNQRCEGTEIGRVTRGEVVTVLFLWPNVDKPESSIAYIRTSDGTYGFLWSKFLSE